MNFVRTTSRALVLALLASLTPTSNRAIAPLIPVTAFLVPSLYVHYAAFPWEGPSRYDVKKLKQAFKDISAGIDVDNNWKIVREQLYYMYIDGICGHISRAGSPRFNEKTKLHEIPFVESRGLFGAISDRLEPVLKTAELPIKFGVVMVALNMAKTTWVDLSNVSGMGAFKNAFDSLFNSGTTAKPTTKIS